MSKTIVVIGGAASGPVAAARARGFDENAHIVLIERNPHVSWVQADLRYHLEDRVVDLAQMDAERASFFEKRHRIEVRTNTEAVALDVDARRVVVKDVEGTRRIGFDSAVFAGGASTRWTKVPGLDAPADGVVGFRKLNDLAGIRAVMARGGKRAVVLGGGRNGFEAACGLVAAGFDVEVLERAGRVLPTLSLPASRAALLVAQSMGIRARVNDDVELCELQADGSRKLTLKSGAVLDVDLVVVAIGLRPSTQILANAGASLNPDGSVRVDAHMGTTLPDVYACGTAVSLPHAVTRSHHWMPHADIGHRTAQVAGRSAAMEAGEFKESMYPVAGTEILEVGAHCFGRTGLSDAEARSHIGDERVQVTTVHSWSSEAWVKSDEPDPHLSLRLIVDREQEMIIGGEAWGTQGIPRRIDLLAAAVLERWSPSRLASLDVAYTPSIGPSLDPVQAVGTVSALVLRDEAWLMDAERLALAVARGEDLALVDVGAAGRTDLSVWPEGAVHIPLEELRDRLGELSKEKRVVLLSHTGRRGHLAARLLKQSGFDDVFNLDGGALSWKLTLDE